MRDSHLKPHPKIPLQEEQLEKRTKRSRRDAVDEQAVSLLVLIWTFNVSILEVDMVSASQIPAAGRSASPKIVVKAISCTATWNCWCLRYAQNKTKQKLKNK